MTYRMRPVLIEAIRWHRPGDHPAVKDFRTEGPLSPPRCGVCGASLWAHGGIAAPPSDSIVCPGDMIVTGPDGQPFSCAFALFEARYEPVEGASEGEDGPDLGSGLIGPSGAPEGSFGKEA